MTQGKDTCDGITRRELLRVGGSAMLGLTLADIFGVQQAPRPTPHRRRDRGPGFGKAKSVILLYLQGGPSHLDLWDPKDNVPGQRQERLQARSTPSCPACSSPNCCRKLAQVTDKITLIRSMSYTPDRPVQPHGRHLPDADRLHGRQGQPVGPAGAADAARTSRNFGCNIIRLKPPTVPMLPFVMMPRPLQESNVVGKGGTAGFLGRAYDPYYLYPPGDDMDMNKMDRITVDDLQLRPEVSSRPPGAPRPGCATDHRRACPTSNEAVAKYDLDEYYGKALDLVLSGRARNAFDLSQENAAIRERYGKNTFGQCCLLARRLVEAGTRFVEVNWPKVANSDNHSWDVHVGLPDRMKNQSAPDARRRPVDADRRPRRARPA